MPKPQLHWSHVSLLMKCGIQYEFRYVKGMRRPPGVAAHIGGGTHKGVEVNMLHVKEKRELLPEDAVAEAARDEVNRRFADDGVMLEGDEVSVGLDTIKGEAVDTAVTLAKLHRNVLAPSIQPVHVERKWVIELPDQPFDLSGTIDLQEPDRIRDTKTAAKSPNAEAAHNSDQLSFYALAALVHDKQLPKLQLDYLVKTKTPKVVTLETERSREDLTIVVRRLQVVMSSIQTGVFLPAPQDSWVCTRKFCGWFDMCPYSRKRVTVAAGIDEVLQAKEITR